jgi:hypothetical protein
VPPHPELPERRVLASRRTPRVAPPRPARNPHRHGGSLREQLGAVQRTRALDGGVDPDLVFKIRAARGRLNEGMLSSRGVTFLSETTDYTYFVLSRDDARQLDQALAGYERGPDVDGASGPSGSLFDWVDAIEPYGPEDRRGPGLDGLSPGAERNVVDVSVWPSSSYDEAERRAEIVRRVVGSGHGQVLLAAVGVRRTVLRVAVSIPGLSDILTTSVVERVRTPPVPFLDPSDWRNVGADDLLVRRQASAAVGVLDDAPATGHPLLQGLVRSVIEIGPADYAWPPQGHHGSLVTGRILFPALQAELRGHTPVTAVGEVHVARILEPDPFNPWQTRFAGGDRGEPPHVVVERAIRALHAAHHVRVLNLSLGFREPFTRVHVGELTEMLDDLAAELDIVIIVPTGNVTVHLDGRVESGDHARDGYPNYLLDPEHRLSEPGPAALALTVGAIAHSDAPAERDPPRLGNQAIAGIGHLAPFSRTGPGVGPGNERVNKPDLVDEGGNWVLDDTGQVIREDPGVAVISTALEPSGRLFRACCGTSFAAPAVARCAADVLHQYPGASANLIRALVASSAREPSGALGIDEPARRHLYGIGQPDSARAVSSGGPRVTMTFDGAMDVDTAVIHPVPVPGLFAAGRSRTRRLRIALAYDPPVRRQRREYLAGTMQLDLYRNIGLEELAEIVARQNPEDPAPLVRDRRRVAGLRPGVSSVRYSTLHMREWAPLQLNVDDGDTYYLVATHRTQVWARNSEYASQRYALAVTLEDQARLDLDLYALVTQQVRIATRARVRA